MLYDAGLAQERSRRARGSKRKGSRVEREIVRRLQDAGFAAEKQPYSGALGGRWSGDISTPVLGDDWKLEVKARKRGLSAIYDWLGSNHALILRQDRSEPLVVLTLKRAIEILKIAEQLRTRAVR